MMNKLVFVWLSLFMSTAFAQDIQSYCYARIFEKGGYQGDAQALCIPGRGSDHAKSIEQVNCVLPLYSSSERSMSPDDYNQKQLTYCGHKILMNSNVQSYCYVKIFEKGKQSGDAKFLCIQGAGSSYAASIDEVDCLVQRYNPSERSSGPQDYNQAQLTYCKAAVKVKKVEQQAKEKDIDLVNNDLRPPSDTQITLNNIRIPKKNTCTTVEESNTAVQCYVCRKQESVSETNGILYEGARIMLLTHVVLQTDRKELTLYLENDPDLNMIRCYSKSKINIEAFEGVNALLKPSGLMMKEAGDLIVPAKQK